MPENLEPKTPARKERKAAHQNPRQQRSFSAASRMLVRPRREFMRLKPAGRPWARMEREQVTAVGLASEAWQGGTAQMAAVWEDGVWQVLDAEIPAGGRTFRTVYVDAAPDRIAIISANRTKSAVLFHVSPLTRPGKYSATAECPEVAVENRLVLDSLNLFLYDGRMSLLDRPVVDLRETAEQALARLEEAERLRAERLEQQRRTREEQARVEAWLERQRQKEREERNARAMLRTRSRLRLLRRLAPKKPHGWEPGYEWLVRKMTNPFAFVTSVQVHAEQTSRNLDAAVLFDPQDLFRDAVRQGKLSADNPFVRLLANEDPDLDAAGALILAFPPALERVQQKLMESAGMTG